MTDFLLLAAILCSVALVGVYMNKRLLTLVLSSAFMLLVAMRLSVLSMYLMGTVLMALPVASWTITWLGARYLRVKMWAPKSAFEGEAVSIRVDVFSPFPAFSLLVQSRCKLPEVFQVVDGSENTVFLPEGVRQEYQVIPRQRGVYDLDLASVTIHDPLGIFTVSRRFPQTHSLVVYPTGIPLGEVAAQGRHRGVWLLDTNVGHRGDDDGFFGTREYRVGDDMKRIHWRTSARHGFLVVVEREECLLATVWICVDVFRHARLHGPSDPMLERSVKTAVSLMDAALIRGSAVGLLAPGHQETRIPPGASDHQRWRILEALARLRADGNVPLDRRLRGLDVGVEATVAIVTSVPTHGMVRAAESLIAGGARAALVVVGLSESVASPASDVVSEANAAGMETMSVRAA